MNTARQYDESEDKVIAAVAATLRQVADWGLLWASDPKPARDELRDIAAQVETIKRDDACCPLCEEVTCDEGCALEGLRS